MAGVSSVEPSSTMTTSMSLNDCWARDVRQSSRYAATLNIGTTTLTRGDMTTLYEPGVSAQRLRNFGFAFGLGSSAGGAASSDGVAARLRRRAPRIDDWA